MRLKELGWNSDFESHFARQCANGSIPARVSEENKGHYRVIAECGTFLSRVAGRVRFFADERNDFPAVGDWVVIEPRIGEEKATITSILPRKTTLSRKMAGRALDQQILATNLDIVFVVTSLNQEFNARRIERYLALVWDCGARPIVLLTKADLCEDSGSLLAKAENAAPGVEIHRVSAVTGSGFSRVREILVPGCTAALIGSSGVGKSTIINVLSGNNDQRVKPVRSSDDRGRHTTTSRQMFLLEGGGILIDTPGMRELQLWGAESGVSRTFEDLEELSTFCKFRDCSHKGEPGCAVETAIQAGEFDPDRMESYKKLQAELLFLETKTNVQARLATKQRAKRACKALKNHKKN